MWGDKNRQTMRDKGRQDLGKADAPSTQAHMWGDNGRQGEMRFRAGGHTIQPDIVSKQREPNQYTAWGRISIFYLNCNFFLWTWWTFFFLLIFPDKFPVVPRKERAKVSEIGTYGSGCLWWITDGRANPRMDRKVIGVVFFGVDAMVAVVTSPTTAGCTVV